MGIISDRRKEIQNSVQYGRPVNSPKEVRKLPTNLKKLQKDFGSESQESIEKISSGFSCLGGPPFYWVNVARSIGQAWPKAQSGVYKAHWPAGLAKKDIPDSTGIIHRKSQAICLTGNGKMLQKEQGVAAMLQTLFYD